MPRSSDSRRRFTPSEDPSVDLSSDSDSAVIIGRDDIGSASNSPTRKNPSVRVTSRHDRSPTRSSQRSLVARQVRGAEHDRSVSPGSTVDHGGISNTPHPEENLFPSTPASRRAAAQKLFNASLDSPSTGTDVTPRRLFHPKTSPSKPSNCSPIVISDSEEENEDEEMAEVSDILTDIEEDIPPISKKAGFSMFPQGSSTSFSSIGSAPPNSGVTKDGSFSSFSSISSFSSSSSATFQSNKATANAIQKTSPPTKTSPAKDNSSKARPISDSNTTPRATASKIGASTPGPSIVASVSRTSYQKTSISNSRGNAPIKLARVSPRSAAPASASKTPTPPASVTKPGPSPALQAFVKLNIGENLDIVEVCHDANVQQLLDKAGIAWGVQYELARGVIDNRWTWDDVSQRINHLRGSNAEIAARVVHIMKDQNPRGRLDTSLWEELDREQEAIIEDVQRGLGCMGEWKGVNPWWGGRIQQLARLEYDGDGSYQVYLEPMEQRRCHRLARYLGSRRVLQLRINENLVMKENEKLVDFLSQKFVICGRVFVPLSSKDNGVYLVEVNEDYERLPSADMGDQHRLNLSDIITWANSLELNFNQPISKWSARFALTLSNSVPILEFDEDKMYEIDDLYSPSYDGKGKASSEQILTDGCSFMNAAALKRIQTFLGFEFRPTAVQGRIKGAKGVWTLHPTDEDEEPKIWLRKSQIKVELKAPLNRSQRIFDFLACTRPSTSVSLSSQTIMNLSFNGVPNEILVKMMEEGLREEAEPLMKWQGPQAMQILWDTVAKFGGVSRARAVRAAGALSRALGLERRDWGHDSVEMKGPEDKGLDLPEDTDDDAEATSTGRKPYSGAPLSLHEVTLELLQAGFKPQEFEYLKKKVKYIMELHINGIVEKYNIPLSVAVNNYVIPDPCDVLGPDEVYYRSSTSLIDPATQNPFNVFTGPVLIGRYPVRLPSDIQKYMAVDYPELAQYPDVLIVSTKGQVSIASLLSGGDYDGDECFIIADPELVEPFESKPLSEQPTDLMDDFKKDVIRIEDFVKELQGQLPDKPFVQQLLLGLHDSKKGLYSTFHDRAVWLHGYDHPLAIKLAYKFNTLLDSGKTGHRLKDGVFNRDQRAFGGKVPSLSELRKSEKRSILHALTKAGQDVGEQLREEFDAFPSTDGKDNDLLQPFRASLHQASIAEPPIKQELLTAERNTIQKHVQDVYQQWQVAIRSIKSGDSSTKKKARTRKAENDPMLAIARSYASDISGIYLFPDPRLIKASFAYSLSPAFALQVAFRDICELKARNSPGGLAPVTRAFDEAKAITNSYVRAIGSISSD